MKQSDPYKIIMLGPRT